MIGKGKGKSKFIDQRAIQSLSPQLQGSIDPAYFIECKLETGQSFKARILQCRLHKQYNALSQKDYSSYEYYVHYQALNKRNDQWVPFDRIKILNQIIQDTQKQKSKKKEAKVDSYMDQNYGMDAKSIKIHQQITKVKLIESIQIGKHFSKAWYYSPFPNHFANLECLYFCEFCLTFFPNKKEIQRHSQNCPLFHPPGNQVYRDLSRNLSIFQIDGRKNSVYCENLAYLSKIFLDHKNLAWDMSIFLFYILCEIENGEFHIAGYFSKSKDSDQNLSCILVFPFYQRKGYGKFLISFSYELSWLEGKIGTPQKPLSDLGRSTYLSWWSQRLITYFFEHKDQQFTLSDISKQTSMLQEDIIWTLEQNDFLKVKDQVPYLCVDQDYLKKTFQKYGKAAPKIKREQIHWVPYNQRMEE